MRTQSHGRIYKESLFFITEVYERIILRNDNLPKLGIEVKQKKYTVSICSVIQSTEEIKSTKLTFL